MNVRDNGHGQLANTPMAIITGQVNKISWVLTDVIFVTAPPPANG